MVALYQTAGGGAYKDSSLPRGVGQPSRNSLGFGCSFADLNLDGHLDLVVVNGHIDETVRQIRGNTGYAQAPHLFLNDGKGNFRDVASQAGAGFASPKVARGLAYGDFDRDGDVDLLVTTNGGGAQLYRNDLRTANRSLRLRLVGTKSNRDAVGAVARIFTPDGAQLRMVKTGSSYLSQSELTLTFGLGRREAVRAVIEWPSGAVQEFKNVQAGSYTIVEGGLPAPVR
jgi:enediyne biosynthesis protein E4